MDLYGRPQAPSARRTSNPNVSFLNERAKSLSFSAGFTAPIGPVRRDDPRDSASNVKQQSPPVNSNNIDSNISQSGRSANIEHQRPPATARPSARPQSGGVRRPDSSGAVSAAPAAKPRPRTARDGFRSGICASPALPSAFVSNHQAPLAQAIARATCFDDREERQEAEERPESDDNCREQLYIQQLKDDILFLHQLRQEKERPGVPLTSNHTAHNHVNNVLHMRDSRAVPGWEPPRLSPATELMAKLRRYNYSTDPTQLVGSKTRLEAMLEDILIAFTDEFAISEDVEEQGEDKQRQQPKLIRPPGATGSRLPFANGCGTSAGSIYTGALVSVLDQAEKLKRTALASVGEQKVMERTMSEQNEQVDELRGQIAIYKDVLQRARLPADISVDYKKLMVEAEGFLEPATSSYNQQDMQEHLDKIADLDCELVRARAALLDNETRAKSLQQQISTLQSESESSIQRYESAIQHHQLALASSEAHGKALISKNESMVKKLAQLEALVQTTENKLRSLDIASSEEKAQLRREKLELEDALQRKRREFDSSSMEASANTERKLSELATQVRRTKEEYANAQLMLQKSQAEVAALQTEIEDMRRAKSHMSETVQTQQIRLRELEQQLTESSTTATTATQQLQEKEKILEQSEARLAAAMDELERLRKSAHHHENQVQLLEEKLSRSITVDDDEWQRRRQQEESTWNQQITSLEHALASERQNRLLLQDQHSKALEMAREKTEHAVAQAQAVSEELATANLCLAERKRQRERDQSEWEAKITTLTGELATVKQELSDECSRQLAEQAKMHAQELEKWKHAPQPQAETVHSVDLELKNELLSLHHERDEMAGRITSLEHALATAEATISALSLASRAPAEEAIPPSSNIGSPWTQAHVAAELRVELQRAKQKIAALEAKAGKHDSARAKDADGKMALLSARERRASEDQKATKKQRAELAAERKQFQQERETLERIRAVQIETERKHIEDKGLLQKIITLLASRLKVQMSLFAAVPGEIASWSASTRQSRPSTAFAQRSDSSATFTDFLAQFQRENVEQWRALQQLWEVLRSELEDADWQLLHMKNRLEELHIEYVGRAVTPISSLPPPVQAPVAVRPFSDAVAAGKETVPVADQLHASASTRALPSPSNSPERRALKAKAEEQETFALALAKEMQAMKASYESKLDELRTELKTAQKLRAETAQRLRGDLELERQRSQQMASLNQGRTSGSNRSLTSRVLLLQVAQLSERITSLEQQLAELQRAIAARQDAEIALLDRLAAAPSEAKRRELMQQLQREVAAACVDERGRRERERKERLERLHSYCGSSSVSVAGREEDESYL